MDKSNWIFSYYGDSQFNEETGQWNEYDPWEPGGYGKGIYWVDNEGEHIVTWSVETIGFENDDGYHHEDMIQRHGVPLEGYRLGFAIYPDGTLDGEGGGYLDSKQKEQIKRVIELDPRLKMGQHDHWFFASTGGDVLNWDEGQEGKGLIIAPSQVHTWDVDEFETHWDYIHHLDSSHQVDVEEYFWIDPTGKVSSAGLFPIKSHWLEVIQEADPRLHGEAGDPIDGLEPQWDFTQS